MIVDGAQALLAGDFHHDLLPARQRPLENGRQDLLERARLQMKEQDLSHVRQPAVGHRQSGSAATGIPATDGPLPTADPSLSMSATRTSPNRLQLS